MAMFGPTTLIPQMATQREIGLLADTSRSASAERFAMVK